MRFLPMSRPAAAAVSGVALVIVILVAVTPEHRNGPSTPISFNNPSQGEPNSLASASSLSRGSDQTLPPHARLQQRTTRLTSGPTERIVLNVSSQPKDHQDLISQNLMFCCVRDGNDLHNMVRSSRCLVSIAQTYADVHDSWKAKTRIWVLPDPKSVSYSSMCTHHIVRESGLPRSSAY